MDKNYHLDKTNFFKERNIQVLHFWDKEWIEQRDIVKSMILSKLGIYNERVFARKCIVREIPSNEANDFLSNTHMQGGCNAKVNLGMYHSEELVQVLSFGRPRYNEKHEWELLRFSSKLNATIVGGFAKVLNHFKSEHKGSIISYCDLRYSTGKVYLSNGFELTDQSSPNYFYTKDYCTLESRVKYQKHKLRGALQRYDESLTEWENMQLNGFDRVWDCGNLVFQV